MLKSEFGINDDFGLQVMQYGTERRPVVVIDHPFVGAENLRRVAIEQNRFVPADSFYPGVRMEVSAHYSIALLKILERCASDFFNLNLRRTKRIASRYSIVTTRPENLSPMQTIPHFDAPNPKGLAMVLFLQEGSCPGTAFYKHRSTGYEYINENRYKLYMPVIREQLKGQTGNQSGYIYRSTAEFEQIANVEGRFNRLIVYFGSSLHSGVISPDYNFDPFPSSGRLTITTFLECE